VFYITHKEIGARRNKPLEDTAYTTLSMLHARDALNSITTIRRCPPIKSIQTDVETDQQTQTSVDETHQERKNERQIQPTSTVDSQNQNSMKEDKGS